MLRRYKQSVAQVGPTPRKMITMTPLEDPAAPTDQEPTVRPDLGGWISGPCLDLEKRDLPVDGWADLEPAPPAERHPGPGPGQ
jgi:hypothetical protein